MTKKELINAVHQEMDEVSSCSKATAELAVNATMKTITTALVDGEKVKLTGFGTFEAKPQAARQGRNPKTGAIIEIAARNVPKFRPGKELKTAVNCP